jgi:hypothetical protein
MIRNPNSDARRELKSLVGSRRHAWDLETVVMADLRRRKHSASCESLMNDKVRACTCGKE